MSTAGGAASVVVDILANSSQLGTSLQQAEKVVEQSAQKMGKAMDNAIAAPKAAAGRMAGGRAQAALQAVAPLVISIADDMKNNFEQRFDMGDSISKGLRAAVAAVPHPAAQMGVAIADAITPYGERAGRSFAMAFLDTTGMVFAEEFESGSYYGIGDMFSDFINNRTVRMPFTGVRVAANANLIADRQRELAALSAEQQILTQQDRRSQMIQQRLHLGRGEVDTAIGTYSFAIGGSADEASKRVFDAAMRQVMALERIEAIVKEIGGAAARTSMGN